MEEDKSRYIIAFGSDEIIIKREMPEDVPGSTTSREGVINYLLLSGASESFVEDVFRTIEESEEKRVVISCEWTCERKG